MCAFNGCNGRESPARSTSQLVLDIIDSSFISPVNGIRGVSGRELHNFWLVLGDRWWSFQQSVILCIGPSWELVVSQPVGGLLGVCLLNKLILDGKLLESESIFFLSSEWKSILSDVSEKFVFDNGVFLEFLWWEGEESRSLFKNIHFKLYLVINI